MIATTVWEIKGEQGDKLPDRQMEIGVHHHKVIMIKNSSAEKIARKREHG